MKDCYKITRNIKVCGILDKTDDDKLFIRVCENKDSEAKIIDFDEILDSLLGTQVLIQSEDKYCV